MSEAAGQLRFDHSDVVTQADRRVAGRNARRGLPRARHAEYTRAPDRDPLGIIDRQNAVRAPELVPLRIQRMAESPFAFYRGTAAVQAADLARGPRTGRRVVTSGDAHLSNFGFFASPSRDIVFDLNDFDEAAFAPWEWDVKRLLTSVVIASQANGFEDADVRSATLTAARAYRLGLEHDLSLGAVERYYLRAEAARPAAFGPEAVQAVNRTMKRARGRTSAREFARIMEIGEDGSHRLREQPPTLTHVEAENEAQLTELVDLYRTTVAPDIALLLSQYTPTDLAVRVVGVGSVGTRCFIVVLTGPSGEPLVLQVKEARRSVFHEFGGLSFHPASALDPELARTHHGYRVVSYQRILQAASDPFLGYLNIGGRSFYVRQFRDMNASIEIAELGIRAFSDYAQACAHQLARAHAQSPEAAFVAGYLGNGTTFDEAATEWSLAYAEQSLDDYRAFRAAVAAGRFSTASPA